MPWREKCRQRGKASVKTHGPQMRNGGKSSVAAESKRKAPEGSKQAYQWQDTRERA